MRPSTLEEALEVGLEIEAFYTVKKQRNYPGRRVVRAAEVESKQSESVTKEPTGTATEEIRRCQQSMADLQSEVKAMRSELQLMKNERRQYNRQGRQGRGNPAYTEDGAPICFKCRKPGHLKRNCPDRGGAAERQSELSSENDQLSGMGVTLRQ
ncbi:hypothetical protein HOLleu_32580 [Holothuria leucospilota]|uniref:CCHC-type domain-containing protein n=1 Tax=Holothuria leucospilota TaxID=206669 RepID=A0A9Q1H026_HOLLE|nr:hypothetical protein HOLleu_32580 [Holothuria leucospilota]